MVVEFESMKYLSLFSGIGGFELGIQQAYEERNLGVKPTDKKSEQTKSKIQFSRRNKSEKQVKMLIRPENYQNKLAIRSGQIIPMPTQTKHILEKRNK